MSDSPAHAAPAAPQLKATLAPRHISMISIGGIIGAGLFVGSSAAFAAAGPAALLSYAATGILILLIMRMLAEMTLALPAERSFQGFVRAGLGPGAAFVAGWLYWYFWVIVIPVEAIAGAAILHAWIALPAWLLGLALMAVMTAINLMSARSFGEFEFWFASIKVAAILAFIVLCAAWALGGMGSGGPTFSNLTAYGGFAPRGAAAVLAGMTTAFFSMTGPEIATVAAAESREPARAIARMSSNVITRIMVFYLGALFLIVAVVPWTLIRSGESPFTLALNTIHWPLAARAMSLIILTAVLSCLNSSFYVCSRMLFLLAGQGLAPAALVQVNARHVPARSVWIGAIAGILGILASIMSPNTVFAFLVNASGALILFVYLLIAVAQIRLRRQRAQSGIDEPALRMWGFPWLSYAAIGGMAAVLIAMTRIAERATELYVSLIALLIAVAAWYLWRAGYRRVTAAR